MKIKAIFGTGMIWAIMVCVVLSVSKPVHKMTPHGGPDKVAADEQPSKYPALDLEDLCKQSKNPKCEVIVDDFCTKSCLAKLCEKYGSIRAMCRLMCEAEDLLPQCSRMSPPKAVKNNPPNQCPLQYQYPQG